MIKQKTVKLTIREIKIPILENVIRNIDASQSSRNEDLSDNVFHVSLQSILLLIEIIKKIFFVQVIFY